MPIYYLGNTNADLSTGADFNKYLEVATEGSNTISFSIAKSATETSCSYTRANVPYNADWDTGGITVEVNVTTASSDVYLSVQVHRINSSGTVQESSTATSEQQLATTGVKTFNVASKDWTAGNVTDRIRVDYIFRNSKTSAARTVAIGTGTTDTEHTTSIKRFETLVSTPIACLSGCSATLTRIRKVVGNAIPGVALPSATLTVTKPVVYEYLDGYVVSISGLSGAVRYDIPLGSTVASVSGCLADLKPDVLLRSTIGITSLLSSSLRYELVLQSTVSSISGCQAGLRYDVPISGITGSISGGSADLKFFVSIGGGFPVTSSAYATLKYEVYISSTTSSVSGLTGSLSGIILDVLISGTSSSSSDLSLYLRSDVPVVSSIGGTSSLSADLKFYVSIVGSSVNILKKIQSESVIYLDMDEGTGNPTDHSVYGNVYDKGGSTWVYPAALSFDGIDDCLTGSSGDRSEISMHTNDCTVIFKLLFDDPAATVEHEMIVYTGAGGGSSAGYYIRRGQNVQNSLTLTFCDGSAPLLQGNFASPITINDKKYHIIMAEYDRDGYLNVYYDNQVATSQMDISAQQGDVQNSRDITIGAISSGSQRFSGDIAFFTQVNRLLSAEEKTRICGLLLPTSILRSTVSLSGTVGATSSLSAAMRYELNISSIVSGASNLEGICKSVVSINGLFSGDSNLLGSIKYDVLISSVISSVSSLSSTIRLGVSIISLVDSVSSLVGNLTGVQVGDNDLFGEIIVSSTLNASMRYTINVLGSSSGASSLSGGLRSTTFIMGIIYADSNNTVQLKLDIGLMGSTDINVNNNAFLGRYISTIGLIDINNNNTGILTLGRISGFISPLFNYSFGVI